MCVGASCWQVFAESIALEKLMFVRDVTALQ